MFRDYWGHFHLFIFIVDATTFFPCVLKVSRIRTNISKRKVRGILLFTLRSVENRIKIAVDVSKRQAYKQFELSILQHNRMIIYYCFFSASVYFIILRSYGEIIRLTPDFPKSLTQEQLNSVKSTLINNWLLLLLLLLHTYPSTSDYCLLSRRLSSNLNALVRDVAFC